MLVINFTFVQPGYSQECSYIVGKNNEVNSRFIKIDGKIFAYLPKDKAISLFKDASSLDLKIKELALESDKSKLLQLKVSHKDELISILKISSLPDPVELSFFDKSQFHFFSGFTLAVISFFIWKYTD